MRTFEVLLYPKNTCYYYSTTILLSCVEQPRSALGILVDLGGEALRYR
jgi:hypothetical protein